ncbi:MAG: acetylornithine transaminase [Streptosporangiales bacterium]|nr:acetylornithine transaminase [Streptosporangiales bacterium]
MSLTDDLRERFTNAFMPTYGTPPVALVEGSGARVRDADGREYVDLIAGIAVSALGHAHPAIVAAVAGQVARIGHTSNLFVNEPAVLLAERLLGLLGDDARVFLTNSGTEANEAAIKLVRSHAGAERTRFVATRNGFHGRSLGALALTGKEAIRAPFQPYGIDVTFVPYGDGDALRDAVDETCAGVFLEPTQGEAGVVPAPAGYLAAARKVCDDTGAVFVLDEIQSGIGRTGAWFAHQTAGVRPDVLTLAKGLGGGLPIGACVGFGPLGTAFAKGAHGSTFGGNPVASAAALAVLDTIERDGLLAHVREVGDRLAGGLASCGHPLVAGVHGSGLWLGLALTAPMAPAVEAAARDAGFLVNAVQPDRIRIAPPLVLGVADADAFVAALPAILDAAHADQGGTR